MPPDDIPDIEALFGQAGPIAEALDGYTARPGQIDMARRVLDAIVQGGSLIVEAGTGTGKSIAYAVPATWHASRPNTGAAVLVTANIALQEQLVEKDLPFLQDILPWEFTFALAKGVGNFLCLDRLADTLEHPSDDDREDAVRAWAKSTKTGDKSELDFAPDGWLWSKYSVAAAGCKGADCQYADDCHVLRMKAAYRAADVVVCNYHLLFAHVQVRERTGMDAVLPEFDVLVLDEAHQAAHIARSVFGFQFGMGAIRRVAKAAERAGFDRLACRLTDTGEKFFDRLREYRNDPEYKVRIREEDPVDSADIRKWLKSASPVLLDASTDLRDSGDAHAARSLQMAGNRADEMHRQIAAAMSLVHPDLVYYIDDIGGRTRLCCRPVVVAPRLASSLFGEVQTAVLTSATLSVGGDFSHVSKDVGISAPGSVVDSPFDFRSQAMMVCPDMPMPNTREFPGRVGEVLGDVIAQAGGRTLGLFTSYRVLNVAHKAVKDCGYRVLRQGDMPRTKLIQEFRDDTTSVLLGTESFWAGVDVPGEALSAVVIDRLPFPTPGDPVMDAICERNNRWFMEHSVPRAVIAFKQGVGRLIRGVGDRGVVVCLDHRLVAKPYGGIFFASLPPMGWSTDVEDIGPFLSR